MKREREREKEGILLFQGFQSSDVNVPNTTNTRINSL